MKIIRYTAHGADPAFGILDGDDVVELHGDPLLVGIVPSDTRVPIADIKLLAPVIPRSKIICVGRNYADHAKEFGNAVPKSPMLFFKPNTSVIGPHDNVVVPEWMGRVDLEAELTIVIGNITKNIAVDDALSSVFGFTVANDISSRTLQDADGQWARAKGADTFCPVGPAIETELDYANVTVSSAVNGEPHQNGNTSDMVFSVPELIAFASQSFTLLPGDLILTGTPAGVAQIKPGDMIEVSVEGIGTLVNPVIGA